MPLSCAYYFILKDDLGKWKTTIEKLAWKKGIIEMKKHNITINLSMYKYAVNCLKTYYKRNG